MVEVMIVLGIIALAGAYVVPKLFVQRHAAEAGTARATLDSAWEDAQDYYRGERGTGQLEHQSDTDETDFTASAYDGFDPATAAQLNPKLAWASYDPATDQSVTAVEGLRADGDITRKVFIADATNQVLAMCAAAPNASPDPVILCKGDDGKAWQDSNGKQRLGPRYGASSVSVGDALTKLCAADAAAASSSAGQDATEACPSGPLDTSITNDQDADSIRDGIDNCPADANPDQADLDEDGKGDLCDPLPNGPPANVTSPKITGVARVGQQLEGTVGVWNYATAADSVKYSITWQRQTSAGAWKTIQVCHVTPEGDQECAAATKENDCATVTNCGKDGYLTVDADRNRSLRLKVIAYNADGPGEPAYSDPFGPINDLPSINFTSVPAHYSAVDDLHPQVAWTIDPPGAGVTSECRLNGNSDDDWYACESPERLSLQSCKNYTLEVRAKNSAGAGAISRTDWEVACQSAAKPANTELPAVSGDTTQGETLTTTTGSWQSDLAFSTAIQWLRCDNNGDGCSSIAGATANTYVLTGADVGYRLRSQVTATNATGSTTVRSLATNVVEGTGQSGPATVSFTVTPDDPTPSNVGSKFNWQIAGPQPYFGIECSTDGGAYTTCPALRELHLDPGDHSFKVKACNSNGCGETDLFEWTVSDPVPLPTITTKPGNPQTLGQPATFAWTIDGAGDYDRVECRLDEGSWAACSNTITYPAQVVGYHTFDVRACQGASNCATTSYGWAVDGNPPVNVTAPTITMAVSGVPSVSSNGTWTGDTPITYAYQWQKCDAVGAACADIAAATGSTYNGPQPLPANTSYRVKVTATNSSGSASAYSVAINDSGTASVSNTSKPTISGSASVGAHLNAAPGTWTPASGVTFAIQWQRCNAAGAACVNIAGATSASYLVTSADLGATLRVTYTGTKGASSATATSAQSAVVVAMIEQTVNLGVGGMNTNGGWTCCADYSSYYSDSGGSMWFYFTFGNVPSGWVVKRVRVVSYHGNSVYPSQWVSVAGGGISAGASIAAGASQDCTYGCGWGNFVSTTFDTGFLTLPTPLTAAQANGMYWQTDVTGVASSRAFARSLSAQAVVSPA